MLAGVIGGNGFGQKHESHANRERRLAVILPCRGVDTLTVGPMRQKWMIIIAALAFLSLTFAAANLFMGVH
jgi:hypothetical protein